MEPFPSRRPLASRYAGSTNSTPSPTSGLNGPAFSPISSPRDTMASRLSSASSSTGSGTSAKSVGVNLRDLPSPTTGMTASPPMTGHLTGSYNPAATSASEMRSNLSELNAKLRELSNLSVLAANQSATASTTASTNSILANYGRSLSSSAGPTSASGPTSAAHRKYSTPSLYLRRGHESAAPSIDEFPSPDIEEPPSTASSSAPLVTLPPSDLAEVIDVTQENGRGSLTSPNLVHNINPGMSRASAVSFAKKESSYQARKESSTSVSTTQRGGASGSVVTSAQSANTSSASRMESAAVGAVAIGQDGQAVITGRKMQSSSSESRESSSSSKRQITANGTEVMASHSHRETSSHVSSKKSSSITMTSASASVTGSLLTSSQVNEWSFSMLFDIKPLSVKNNSVGSRTAAASYVGYKSSAYVTRRGSSRTDAVICN